MYSDRPSVRQRGVTMIELILFIVIVGIAVGGIITVMNLTTRGSADPVRRKQALIIAEGLLEEVEMAKFSFCDPADPAADDQAATTSSGACAVAPERWGQQSPEAAGVGRPYDNVNDYVSAPDTWTTAFNNAAGRLVDASGVELGVSGYSARLKITPVALGGVGNDLSAPPNAANTADTDVLRITVEVSYDGESVTLEGYRLRFAPNFL